MNGCKLAVFSFAALASSMSFADKAAYDGFEKADLGELDGTVGGSGFAAPYVAHKTATVIAKSLRYENGTLTIDGGNQAISMKKAASSDVSVLFSRELAESQSDVFYVSALVNFDSRTKSNGNRDTLVLGLSAGEGVRPHGGFGIEDTAFKWCGEIGTQARLAGVATADTVHFIVAKVYKTDSAGAYNRVDLLVDPSSPEEPAQDSWTLKGQGPGGSTGTTATTFTHLAFYMNYDRSDDADNYIFDEIRVGTSWSDVVVPYQEKTTDATDMHWSGASETSDDWSEVSNWTEGVSPDGNNAYFTDTDVTGGDATNSVIADNLSVNSLAFGNSILEGATASRHVVEVATGKTLTITGTNGLGYALYVGAPSPETKKNSRSSAVLTGGGSVAVDSPDGCIQVGQGFAAPDDAQSIGVLSMDGLSSFAADVSRFVIGYGYRTRGELTLAAAGNAVNTIRADYFAVGDADGVLGKPGTSYLTLGRTNVIHANRINIGATEVSGTKRNNDQSGEVRFSAEVTEPTLEVRSRGGSRRTDMTIASHGDGGNNWYAVRGIADFSGGSVDMMLGELLIAAGTGYKGSQDGSVNGYFTMDAGKVDVNKLSIGRTCIYDGGRNAYNTMPAWGRYTMNGGETIVNDAVEVAVSTNGSWKGGFQCVKGDLSLSNDARFTALGTVVLASDQGYATGAVARVTIEGSALLTAANGIRNGLLVTGRSDSNKEILVTEFEGSVNVNGGLLAVTNDTGTSEFCLDHGTLSVAGGSVIVDKLTMTNDASVISVVLSDSEPVITVKGAADIEGSTVRVSFADGYTPSRNASYQIVSATSLSGKPATVEAPNGFHVRNSASGLVGSYGGFVISIR